MLYDWLKAKFSFFGKNQDSDELIEAMRLLNEDGEKLNEGIAILEKLANKNNIGALLILGDLFRNGKHKDLRKAELNLTKALTLSESNYNSDIAEKVRNVLNIDFPNCKLSKRSSDFQKTSSPCSSLVGVFAVTSVTLVLACYGFGR